MPGISRWSPGILPVYEHFHNYFHYIRKKLIPLALKSHWIFSTFQSDPISIYSAYQIQKVSYW